MNIASAWLLSRGGHDHHHGHSHGHGHDDDVHGHEEEEHRILTGVGEVTLSVFEDGVPPAFRLRAENGATLDPSQMAIETLRPDGARQVFAFTSRGTVLESTSDIPEPHAFTATLRIADEEHAVVFEEHAHSAHDRDNNMRAAVVHVIADAAVSVLVIVGLVLARFLGWVWMDPVAELVGAFVIASWSYGLIRDTGAILLDMNPDQRLAGQIRETVEASGDAVADLHLWRLGPGHLGAILSVATPSARDAGYYRAKLGRYSALSHVTVEVIEVPDAKAPVAA